MLKKLKIVPDFHEQTWFHWMEDCHDWCISRQLWWGHRIPAYHVKFEGEATTDDTDNNYWVSAHSQEDAMKKAQARFPNKNIELFLFSFFYTTIYILFTRAMSTEVEKS